MIFIDTGAFLARYLAKDQYHAPATAFWDELKVRNEGLATSNFVLDETATLLGRRAGYLPTRVKRKMSNSGRKSQISNFKSQTNSNQK